MTKPETDAAERSPDAVDERRLVIVSDGRLDERVGLALPFRQIEIAVGPAIDDAEVARRHDVVYVLLADDRQPGLVAAAAALAQRISAPTPTLLVGLGLAAPPSTSLRAELADATQGWRYRRIVAEVPALVFELVSDGDGPSTDVAALVELAAAATVRSQALGDDLATAEARREVAEDDLRRWRVDGERTAAEVVRLNAAVGRLGRQLVVEQQRGLELQSSLDDAQRRLAQLRQTKAVRATSTYWSVRRSIARRLPGALRRSSR